MRKLFSILAATFVATTMFAATATMQYTNTTTTTNMAGDGANNAELVELNPAVFTVIADKGGTSNFPGLNKAKEIRLYADKGTGNGNIITVSITGGTINSIVLDIKQTATFVVKAGSTAVTEASGAYAINGASFSIQNTNKGATTQLILNKITIDYTLEGVTVEAPTFEPKEGNFEGAVTVTLACATEGASIFFTADGSEPATEAGGATQAYSAPFPITETATIKAIAVKGADKSAVAEKTYTKLVVNQYEVKEAIDAGLNKGDLIKVRGVVTNMAAKGKNFATYGTLKIYVKDATGAEGEFQFFNCASLNEAKFETTVPAYDATSDQWADFTSVTDADGHILRVGDTIVAKGTYELFNSTYELQQGCFLVDIKSAPFVPQTIDITVTQGNNMVKWTDAVADEGWWQIIAQNDDYYVTLSNGNTVTAASGTYEVADLDDDYSYIYDADDNQITLASGSVTITVNADESVTAVGQFVGSDGNTYKVDLTFTEVEIISTVNVEIAEWTVIDTYASYGLLGVQGTAEDETMVQFAVWNDDAEAAEDFYGTYTEDDLDYEYIGSGILLPTGGQILIYAVEITVAAGEGDAVVDITAQVLAPDGVLYNITTSSAPAGINNVEAMKKVVKAIENGQLIINVNGVRYNVTGIRVK